MRNLPLFLLTCLTALIFIPTDAEAQEAEAEAWAHLPEPVTNNAVAGARVDGRMMAYSFAGLHEGKTWRDVTSDAYACDLEARECREMEGLPDGIGRLASVAVNVREQIYIFGGYTVAEDGSERSTPEVWRFDPASETYTLITRMPVPVDDTIALPFEDRYIYLVSGWHDTDNVDLVQVYDVEENRWFDATPFPGAPVFGHAGGITTTGEIMVCGGTAVIPPAEVGGRRSFAATDACTFGRVSMRGELGHDQIPVLEWVSSHTYTYPRVIRGWRAEDLNDVSVVDESVALYRAAVVNLADGIVFIGGSDNAYNFSGIGYNGEPSSPLEFARFWHGCGGIKEFFPLELAPEINRMDLRGAVYWNRYLFTLGGMSDTQIVTDSVQANRILGPNWVFDECVLGAE